MQRNAEYVAVIQQAIAGKCRSDVGEVTLATQIVEALVSAGLLLIDGAAPVDEYTMKARIRSVERPVPGGRDLQHNDDLEA